MHSGIGDRRAETSPRRSKASPSSSTRLHSSKSGPCRPTQQILTPLQMSHPTGGQAEAEVKKSDAHSATTDHNMDDDPTADMLRKMEQLLLSTQSDEEVEQEGVEIDGRILRTKEELVAAWLQTRRELEYAKQDLKLELLRQAIARKEARLRELASRDKK